jgi:hypothetical protein
MMALLSRVLIDFQLCFARTSRVWNGEPVHHHPASGWQLPRLVPLAELLSAAVKVCIAAS